MAKNDNEIWKAIGIPILRKTCNVFIFLGCALNYLSLISDTSSFLKNYGDIIILIFLTCRMMIYHKTKAPRSPYKLRPNLKAITGISLLVCAFTGGAFIFFYEQTFFDITIRTASNLIFSISLSILFQNFDAVLEREYQMTKQHNNKAVGQGK